jgi:hypothetical protein
VYRPVVPVYTRFLDRSISAFQSISRNSEGHVESVQPIKCMIFILICNNKIYSSVAYIYMYFGPQRQRSSFVQACISTYHKDISCQLQLQEEFEDL